MNSSPPQVKIFEAFELNDPKSEKRLYLWRGSKERLVLLAVTNHSNICDAVLREIALFSTVTKREKWHHCTMPVKKREVFIKGRFCGALCSKKYRTELQ